MSNEKPQPFTRADLTLGEQIVRELHGLKGYDAWAEHLAKVVAAARDYGDPAATPPGSAVAMREALEALEKARVDLICNRALEADIAIARAILALAAPQAQEGDGK